MKRRSKYEPLLSPMDRAGQVLFGLIITLTFTCTVSVATRNRETEIREMLISALGCTIAWGFIDATMSTVEAIARRNRSKVLFDKLRRLSEEEGRALIREAIPPLISSSVREERLEEIRKSLITLPDQSHYARLNFRDIKRAVGVFLFTFVSTFPVVAPFVLMHDTTLALRVSNGIAVVMMFLCGWSVASFAGLNRWLMSTTMVVIGVLFVVITIALGG